MHWTLWLLGYWVASVLVALVIPAGVMMMVYIARDPGDASIIAGSFALAVLTYVPIAFVSALVAGAASIVLVRVLRLGTAGHGRWVAYVAGMAGVFATVVLGTVVFAPTSTLAAAFFLAFCGGVPLLGSLPVLRALRRRGRLPGVRVHVTA
ncbi:hypothetical protein [uncultured Georgenia sp.]|uniref:hypothetical protein n=1 Tax=uncultured Georgenia sp. TaxID=378209 RepID=UPI002609A939|nr:hypothetical protein [uncultured Georgenia sp.]